MQYDGCQGKKRPKLIEKTCPSCGNVIEMVTTDAFTICDQCGFTIYTDLMECVFTCPKAKECVGEDHYERLCQAKEKWQSDMQAMIDDDEW